MFRSLALSALCAFGVVAIVAGAALLRSYGAGQAAKVVVEQYRAALSVTKRHGEAALDGAATACDSRVLALDSHSERLREFAGQQATVLPPPAAKEGHKPKGETCAPSQPVDW